LSSLKQNLGDLDKVKRITKLVGFVQCVDGFTNQPFVINGCSDLMFEVFGDKVGEQLGLKKWSWSVGLCLWQCRRYCQELLVFVLSFINYC
jgi:hypothetical protein